MSNDKNSDGTPKKSFWDHFIERDEKVGEKNSQSSPVKKTAPQVFTMDQSPSTVQPIRPAFSMGTVDEDMVQDYVRTFKDLIKSKNLAGFDFFEFSNILLKNGPNPSVDQYQTTFDVAKSMDESLDKKRLDDAANFYKGLVEDTWKQTTGTGDGKRKDLEKQQAKEKGTLGNDVASLTKQIDELTKQRDAKQQELDLLEGKYIPQFESIDKKFAALQEAHDRIINEIVTLQLGITNNIKE